ncbi:Carbamoyltransferase [Caldisphaera lagunensis DSM 15908]|uniref:Carbamoyltransferase n=1 Tax=Caldisphaera lagunensis (strain DSM 15908 / JCM 11604 / ANMR 0165 / IC-154) TaxID=1056495 RepID=L0A7X4_CALLD|nr:tetratricopeptide repeat protein [Caldisphaera lagunensis]AFZ69973.1 Carbamoyltransferase [Caldisphaera lagunensis DSM 15908]
MDETETLYKVAESMLCMMKWNYCEETYRMLINMVSNKRSTDLNLAGLWHGYAICLERTGKKEESIKAYRIALELYLNNFDKDKRKSYLWGGWCAFKLGKYDLSYRLFEKAVKEDPGYAYSWLSLSMASNKIGNKKRGKEALENYYKIVKLSPYKKRECEGKLMLYQAYGESNGWVKDYIEKLINKIKDDPSLIACRD